MEISDVEDVIPPTPNALSNNACSYIDKISGTSSKLSKKRLKNVPDGCKRKRILSPDYKKVKQKVKQVTLFNFLLKPNTKDSRNIAGTSSNAFSPVKANLMEKFIKTEERNVDVIPETNSVHIDKSDLIVVKKDSPHVNECVSDMCKEVASLEIISPSQQLPPFIIPSSEQCLSSQTISTSEQLLPAENISASEQLPSSKTASISKQLPSSENIYISEQLPSSKTISASEQRSPSKLSMSEQMPPSKNICAHEQIPSSKNIFTSKQVSSPTAISPNKDHSSVLTVNQTLNTTSNASNLKLNNVVEKHDTILEEISNEMDQTFSWMADMTWETEKENFDFSFNFSQDLSKNCHDE